MELSKSQARKIGDRFRKGAPHSDDYKRLTDYRDAHVEPMFEILTVLSDELIEEGMPVVFAGRPKRIKSIVRKLRRSNGTTLDRMGDLAGIRIICSGRKEQQRCREWVEGRWETVRVIDRSDADEGYRAIHMYIRVAERMIEVQLRTPEQHVWADESEAFGERVKEGGGPQEVQKYLSFLSRYLRSIEVCGRCGSERCTDSDVERLFERRRPISRKLPAIEILNDRSRNSDNYNSFKDIANSLVVFNNDEGAAANQFYFSRNETDVALREFRRLSELVDGRRFEVVLLNSGREDVLAITHARFYPDKLAEALASRHS